MHSALALAYPGGCCTASRVCLVPAALCLPPNTGWRCMVARFRFPRTRELAPHDRDMAVATMMRCCARARTAPHRTCRMGAAEAVYRQYVEVWRSKARVQAGAEEPPAEGYALEGGRLGGGRAGFCCAGQGGGARPGTTQ